MCGIFGFIAKRWPEVGQALGRGTHALAHRGPDDGGVIVLPLSADPERCVALGSRRLAIIDLSPAGHQPMHDGQRVNSIVFNGEIYNFAEIRSQLGKSGHSFSSDCDTEVLLKAYGEWGEACLERLRGMFSFAIWDARKARLFLARDRFGVKPLYYYRSPDLFAFASEIRALLASGLVPRKLDPVGMASYLEFGSVQDPLTIIEGVRSLPAGRFLIWERDQCEERTYWDIGEVVSRPPATESFEEAVRDTREVLHEAVSLQLVSDVPLGIFLSGGVDSSCVALLAREALGSPPETFSVIFDERRYSEAEYSELVARTAGTQHHRIEITQQELLRKLPEALASMDQPSVDGLNTYIISEAAKREGITVALTGLGGDELFAGYSTFRHVPRMMAFRRTFGWTSPFCRTVQTLIDPIEADAVAKLVGLAAGDYGGGHPYFLARTLFMPSKVRKLLLEDKTHDRLRLYAVAHERLSARLRGLESVNQVSVLEAMTYMVNTLLRDTDVMSMVHSLEVRPPLLDHKLWEYVLPLRGRLKLDSRLPKPLLLKAVGPRLPEKIYLRRKMGFTLPFERWLRGALRAEVSQELLDGQGVERFLVERRFASKVWDDFLRGKTTWARPWSLFVLRRWVRRNVWESP